MALRQRETAEQGNDTANPLIRKLDQFAEYRELSEVDEIARRALSNNAFDGILTILGVVMGAYVAGVKDPSVVLLTGVSTCVAIGVSGAWGRYFGESAERKNEMQQLGQAMLLDLNQMTKTRQARASQFAVLVVSAVDGLAPLVAGLITVLPFFFAGLLPSILYAYIGSILMAFASLFALGAFLANLAKENLIRGGLRLIMAGVVSVIFSFLLNGSS
ncbi:MAG: VIT1/CCC1 transporter family protein [Chloroflexota bacterium]|nr:VIT1/CCC1 transporter family protein [Chloroflexota bacterium]